MHHFDTSEFNSAGLNYENVMDYLRRLCCRSYVYAHIEPTNACNTNCLVCPRDAMTRKVRRMLWPVFLGAMERILPSPVPMIAFVDFGEPTLHHRLTDMIAYVRDARLDIIIKLTINAKLLDKKIVQRLFGAGLDLLEISVMGTSPEEYQNAMGLSFEWLEQLLGQLNREGRNYTLTTFPMGGGKVETVRSFWIGVGARSVEVKGLHRRGGYLTTAQVDKAPASDYRAREEVWQETLPVDACHKLYLFLHVSADGDIIPCVQDINSKHVLSKVMNISGMDEIVALTRTQRPIFDICQGCELKNQDLLDYYARFFLTRFADRLPMLMCRLS